MDFAIWTSGKNFPEEIIQKFNEKNIIVRYIYLCNREYALCMKKKIKETMNLFIDINTKLLIAENKVDYVLLVNYPYLINEELLAMQDFLNIHNSLLPKYRGLHAFTWAIINGEKEVGYSIHKVDTGIDSGNILNQIRIPVSIDENINNIFEKSKKIVFEWIASTLCLFVERKISFKPQNEKLASFVCKRKPSDGQINWADTVRNIYNLIRAITPPYTKGAFTFFGDKKIFIHSAEIYSTNEYIGIPGQVVSIIKKKGILVKCLDSLLLVRQIEINSKVHNSSFFFKKTGIIFSNK